MQAEKHVPMHLRRKNKMEKSKPRHFEIMPPTGTLMPGQRLNVQVKFMPTEEVSFLVSDCKTSLDHGQFNIIFTACDFNHKPFHVPTLESNVGPLGERSEC